MPTRPQRSAADAGQAALDWASQSGDADRMVAEVEAHVRERTRRRRTAALSAFAAVLIIGFSGYFLRPVEAPTAVPLSARVTHPETQTLPDGSIIELKEGARVAVNYTPAARRITLIAGEAHFQVAKNKERPFIVSTSGVEVRAVGTAFLVQLGPKSVEVVVNEGTVAVDHHAKSNNPANPEVMVTAGESLAVDLSAVTTIAPVEALTETMLSQRLAWRVPRLEFNRTPLAEALPLFNQHSPDALSFEDPAIGRLELSGVIRANDTDSLVLLLKNEFGISAETRGHGIILRR